MMKVIGAIIQFLIYAVILSAFAIPMKYIGTPDSIEDDIAFFGLLCVCVAAFEASKEFKKWWINNIK